MDDPTRRNILKAGAAAAAMAAMPRVFAQQAGKEEPARSTKRAPFASAIRSRGRFPSYAASRRGIERHNRVLLGQLALQRDRGVQGEYRCITADCATPPPASPPARSRSIGRGSPTPTTNSD